MLALVTDSTAALSRSEARSLAVDMLPMTYIVDGERIREQACERNEGYAERLCKARSVSTEAVRTLSFAKVFQRHLKAGNDVLCITISSRLSGTYRSACEAAALVNEPRTEGEPRVEVVDSRATAGALEFIVREARRIALTDNPSLPELAHRVRSIVERQRIVFTVSDMDALRRSGRLGAFSRAVVSTLNRYPIMELAGGAIAKVGMVRGVNAAARALVAQAPEDAHEFVISYFGERGAGTRRLLIALRKRFPSAVVRIKDGGPVLAANIGLGSAGLSWRA